MAQTMLELFEEQVHRSSVRPALRRFHDGLWEEWTWKEWWDAAERFAAGLMTHGVEAGDRIGLISSTRLEWAVADMGIAMAGAISVPLAEVASVHQISQVLKENQIRLVLVEDPIQVEKVLQAREVTPFIERIIYLDQDVLVESEGQRGEFLRLASLVVPRAIKLSSFDEVSARGRASLAEDPRFVAGRRREIGPDSTATIVYTAGVMATPRGVVLTHANLGAQVEALAALQLFGSDDVQLLFLPLAHIFSRVLYLAALAYGMTTVFGRGMPDLMEDLAEVKPTLFASVPRVYERLQQEILEKVTRGGVKERLFPVALEIGKIVRRRSQEGERVGLFLGWEHKIFSRFLLQQVREDLGGKIKFLICGGAPLDKKVAEFFSTSGVLLLEGYGMTEASGAVCFNMPDDYRLGSVGRPLPGVDVTIAEDGEILVRGRTVMRGYLRPDQSVEEGNDEEGWFHTGDLGYFDREGFLFLTDRKRERILTSLGIFVQPGPIEQALREHPLISHALVVGEGRPAVSALLGLDPAGLIEFFEREGLPSERPVRDLLEHQKVRQELQRHLDVLNQTRAAHEAVAGFAIVPEFFTVHNQALTPSGELRRSEVLRRWGHLVDELYQ